MAKRGRPKGSKNKGGKRKGGKGALKGFKLVKTIYVKV